MKRGRTGWIGGLLLAALVVGALALLAGGNGVRAAQSAAATPTPGLGMMGSGMVGRGMNGGWMMDADDMSQMMGWGMTADLQQGNSARPFDQRFLDAMIPHHQMAVRAAQHIIANSARPELRDLAQRIIGGQQREIDQMQAWRAAWYAETPPGGSPGCAGGMMGTANGTESRMGGMMRARTGSGVGLDRMFLQMMIPHHQAAIQMAQAALQQATHAEIKTLARQIITTQQAEISEMRTYLQQWYGVKNP